MNIKDTLWFTGPQGCIGIVMGVTEEGERKAYIGACSGFHEETDAKYIAAHGAPFTETAAVILFRHFNPNPSRDLKGPPRA